MLKVTSFYKFFPIEKNLLKKYQQDLKDKGTQHNARGLILIGEEGINGTISGTEQGLEKYKTDLENLFNQDFFYKNSYCEEWGFRLLSIKIKKEIVSIGKLYPNLAEKNNHISPKEWEKKMNQGVQIIDVRNDYETSIGKFKQATDLEMQTFSEFPDKLEKSSLEKEKETLIYCTGGIRCEKAIEVMKDKGFKKIHQLEGGIINYLEQQPNSQFEGECFVFDHRVALDQNLKPSKKYTLCPHCGQTANTLIECSHCKKESIVCSLCLKKEKHYKTCSKNCAYHFKSGHKCKKKHLKNLHL